MQGAQRPLWGQDLPVAEEGGAGERLAQVGHPLP